MHSPFKEFSFWATILNLAEDSDDYLENILNDQNTSLKKRIKKKKKEKIMRKIFWIEIV